MREPGKFYIDVLDQTEVWLDRNAVEHKIDDMDPDYARNITRWLLYRAELMHERYLLTMLWSTSFLNGEMAQDSADAALDELQRQDPEDWLRDTPLFQRLLARAMK